MYFSKRPSETRRLSGKGRPAPAPPPTPAPRAPAVNAVFERFLGLGRAKRKKAVEKEANDAKPAAGIAAKAVQEAAKKAKDAKR